MKKHYWLTISLALGISIAVLFIRLNTVSVRAASPLLPANAPIDQPRLDGDIDPEPPVVLGPKGETAAPEAILATLEPAWAATVTESTTDLAWGDYDGDGDLDLLAANFGSANRLYFNVGGTLTNGLTLPPCVSGLADSTYAVAWGDYDLDGDLDILVGNDNARNCVFRNDNGTFNLAWLAGASQRTLDVAWAGWAFNSEFSMYFAIADSDNAAIVYRYEAGAFTVFWSGPTGLSNTSVAWGDMDNDGDPDLALGNSGQPNVVYRNDLNTFTPVFTTTESEVTRDIAWGDMNGDGFLDMAVANGATGGVSKPERVYCNNGNNTFTACWASADAYPSDSVAWGDYDGDGDLDLAATSRTNGLTRVYENINGMLDTDPIFDASDDLQDSRAVAWADWDGDGDMELAIGYYGGTPSVVYRNTLGNLSPQDFTHPLFDTRDLAFGDYDGDGDLDLAAANSSFTANTLYRNDNGTFTPVFTTTEALNSRAVAWGDYDGDGDLDLAFANGQNSSGQSNQIYENLGGTFVATPDFIDPLPSDTYDIAFGDYDGDGDLDLAAANLVNGQPNVIHINNQGVFTQVITLGPATDQSLSLAWGDIDQDLDLDLVVANYNAPNRLYLNDGSGGFTMITLPEPNTPCSTPSNTRNIALGDWDGDGDLDILTANAGANGCIQIIETVLSAGGPSFNTAWQFDEPNLDVEGVAFGDHDGDGDLDVAAALGGGTTAQRNRLFTNIGGSLVQTWLAPASASDPSQAVAWGDIDNDGDLDLAFANDNALNRIYLNNWQNSANQLPNDPIHVTILRPDAIGDAAFFSTADILGQSVISIPFRLSDNEGDQAFRIEFQVSWDGGGNWEPACEVGDDCLNPTGTWSNVATISNGLTTPYTFTWNALYQLLAHQNLTLDHDNNQFVPFDQSDEEMDIAFRIVPRSNPYHGGLIQRPAFGTNSNMFRADMRPDWSNSAKFFLPEYGVPGEIVTLTIVITQADRGLPPAYLLDSFAGTRYLTPTGAPISNMGVITSTSSSTGTTFTWTNFVPFGDLFPWQQRVQNTDAIPYENVLVIEYPLRVIRPLTNNLQLSNRALVFDGLHAPFELTSTLTISATPRLEQSWKLVNGQPQNIAAPNDLMTYTLVLTNTGTENAYNVTMSDTLPAQVTWANYLTYTSGTASFTNGIVQWQGDIRVFEPVTVTYRVTVVKPLVGTFFTNTFRLAHSSMITPFESIPVTTTVLAPNLLSSYKTSNITRTELLDPLQYTIVLTNTGLIDALGVSLSDPIPGASTYVSPSLSVSSGVGSYNPISNTIFWQGDVLIGQPVTITYSVLANLPPQPPDNVLTNTVYIDDPVSGAYLIQYTTTITLPDLGPSTKSAQASVVELGDVMTYTIVVQNAGGFSPNSTLLDAFPSALTFVTGSYTTSAGVGGFDVNANAITWTSDLTGGQVVTMTFNAIVACPAPGTSVFTNTAVLEDALLFQTLLNTPATINMPDLSTSSISANVPSVSPGDIVMYSIAIRNTGGYAPNASLTNNIPAFVSFVAGSELATGGVVTYNAGANQIQWQGDLQPGEEVIVSYQVEVLPSAQGNLITNIVDLNDTCVSTQIETTIGTGFVFLPIVINKP